MPRGGTTDLACVWGVISVLRFYPIELVLYLSIIGNLPVFRMNVAHCKLLPILSQTLPISLATSVST